MNDVERMGNDPIGPSVKSSLDAISAPREVQRAPLVAALGVFAFLAAVHDVNILQNVVILARLDFGGAPHRNPDSEEIACPHLHLYREGYGDKWAVPLPTEIFTDINDFERTLDEFMKYCNVATLPKINPGLIA